MLKTALCRTWLSSKTSFNTFGRRCFGHGNVSVDLQSDTGIATVTLSEPPVNSLSGEFLTSISKTMKELSADSSVSGLLITSKFHGKVFSAGLNILEMYNKSDSYLGEFWRSVQEWYIDTYNFPKPVVAAINGHAPAGGCAFALMCDYRVLLDGKTIGLNETQLGIAAPFFFTYLMSSTIGIRQAELALANGTMFSSDQALQANLVDEVVPLDLVIPNAMNQLQKMIKIPQPAFSLSKGQFRGPNVKKLLGEREEDIATFVGLLQKPYVQKVLGKYLENLKNRKK
uniref:Enoyl-CoA delta isomerase 1, mitochondrial n=1 Tax=Phallusia mammillata TaxID=59560 RepID=A0A6F9DAZ1_9ASCI|nr:enoyl-CoA delta isomerase 1, mitochondrial-like [Phallusia mammillata]